MCEIRIIDDTTFEIDELFKVNLKSLFGGKIDKKKSQAIVTILNDPRDGMSQSLSFVGKPFGNWKNRRNILNISDFIGNLCYILWLNLSRNRRSVISISITTFILSAIVKRFVRKVLAHCFSKRRYFVPVLWPKQWKRFSICEFVFISQVWINVVHNLFWDV